MSEISNFAKRNPEEIIIVSIIEDSNPYGVSTPAVTNQMIVDIISENIHMDLILDSSTLDEFIYNYGGIYFTGFDAPNGEFETMVTKRTEEVTSDYEIWGLLDNSYEYFYEHTYET